MLVRPTYLHPAPGTLVKGWRIERPGKATLKVNLEVRNCRPLVLSGGDHALRWGCQFVDPADDARALIASYATA